MKKRYRLTLDFELETKDFTEVPVRRGEWPQETPGQDIVQHLIHVRALAQRLAADPAAMAAYSTYRVLDAAEHSRLASSPGVAGSAVR